MERQSEIRKAFNSFLPAPSRPEAVPEVGVTAMVRPPRIEPRPEPRSDMSAAQRAVLRDLQHSLRRHGIDAELEEIGNGILDALAARPLLCRGLLAAYFLDV